jgi:ribosomal protein S18 acetylase RimI-like enzyme
MKIYKIADAKEDYLSKFGLSAVWGDVQYDDDSTKSLHLVNNSGEIIAFLDIYPLPTSEFGIGQISVNEDFQRRGLASILFKIAKQEIPELTLHSYDWTEAGEKWADKQ